MDNKQNQKEYYLKNRDKFLQYFKQYKIDNKDKLCEYGKTYYQGHKAKYKEMIHCEACNRSYDYSNLSKHKNTKKHLYNLNKN